MRNLLQSTQTHLIGLRQYKVLNHTLSNAFCASWLIALSAQIKVPFYPVPMTMHTFVIALVALLNPWYTSVSAAVFYLGYAAIGIPVLANGNSGINLLFGPTAGYLWGFILMSAIISLLTQWYKPQGPLPRLLFTFIGGFLMFGLGLAHLAYLFGWEIALKTGLMPFLLSEPTKYALAAYLSAFIKNK